MQPYSIDFRKKIEVYEPEKTSKQKVAERFRVTKSFVQKLLKQYQQTKAIEISLNSVSFPSINPVKSSTSSKIFTLADL